MRHALALFAVAITLLANHARAQPAPATQPYHIVQKVKVGGAGGWDSCFADADGRRLYIPRAVGVERSAVAAGAAGTARPRVTVYDLDTLAPIGEIRNAFGVYGVVIDPQTHLGFGSGRPIFTFDTQTLDQTRWVDPRGGSPHGILLEPLTQRVYVLSRRFPNVVVLDAKDGSLVGTIDLGGQPQQGQSDGTGHVYIALQDKNSIAVVDARATQVTARYSLSDKGTGPTAMGLDAKNNILFVMCRQSANCVVMNATDGKILDTLPIGQGADAAGFNPNTMEAFSSQEDGTLTIIKENGPTSFAVEQTVPTMPGAGASTLDTRTNRIILIASDAMPLTPATHGAADATATGRGGGRGIEGDPRGFTILVVGR